MENNIINLDKLDSYDGSVLDAISSKVLDVRINKVERKIEEIQNTVIKNKEATDIDINEAKQMASDAMEVSKVKAKINDDYEGYINQRDLGDKFQLKIGSNQVGDLLRIVGIAMKSSRKTIPYDNKVPKYAKIKYLSDYYGNEHEQFLWNQSECMIAIDDWLDNHGKTKEFYSCMSSGKLAKYIKQLYKDFQDGLFD
jgi:hypothetical protein